MSNIKAAAEDWTGKKFANGWVIDKKLNCAEYRKIYTELTGETTVNKNAHYLCHNEICGIETYIERTVIKRALENNTPCMTKCRGCVDGSKAESCHYSTMARVKPLTKIPDRSTKVKVGKQYGNFKVLSIQSSGHYSDHQRRATVECIHCGHIQDCRFDTLMEGKVSCECFRSRSSGEMLIWHYLKEHNIPHMSEYTFDDLYGDSGQLRYDFAIFDNNNNLIALIEFDGEQHFKPVEYFKGTAGFEQRQCYDAIKDNYAIAQKLPLLRIKYTDFFKIYEILDNFFNSL